MSLALLAVPRKAYPRAENVTICSAKTFVKNLMESFLILNFDVTYNVC